MEKIKNHALAIIISICAAILCTGNLMIVKFIQPQNLKYAAIHFAIGIAMTAAVYFSCKRILKSAPYITAILLLLLFACLFAGHNINGAVRWIKFGHIAFAPALLAMPVLCFFQAYLQSISTENSKRKNIIIMLAVHFLTIVLVVLEPFYSMALFIIISVMIMFCIANFNFKKILIASAAFIIICIPLGITAMQSNPLMPQKNFYKNLFNPNYQTQYHTWSVLTTLKHSIFLGHHNVPTKPEYHLPNAISDSALAAGCGEFGYLFMLTALLMMIMIIICGMIITKRCQTQSNKVLAGGMTAVLALPAIFNTLMMTGVLPMGGVAFPFLSYGGTAILANAAALGCLIFCSQENNSGTVR